MVELHALDWAVILGYLLIAVCVGLVLSRRASKSVNEFFLTGRSLPWWVAGTSMVATSFAADTPLVVSGWVRDFGIWKNWLWWCFAITGMLGTFLFARWWRRGEVMTKAEVAELRYGDEGRPLRAALGFLHAGITNTWTLCWVMLAAAKILGGIFDIDKVLALVIACGLALTYSVLSGMWGVVMTDLLQLTMAIVGAIFLASVCWQQVGGLPEGLGEIASVWPAPADDGSFWTTPLAALAVYLGVSWWAVESVDGSGTTVQRVSAARTETDGMLAVLWFNLIHYAVRPWPWIIVGLASLAVLPNLEVKSTVVGVVHEATDEQVTIRPQSGEDVIVSLVVDGEADDWQVESRVSEGTLVKYGTLIARTDSERAYVAMMVRYLPVGVLGLVIASLLAAFMSTIDTHSNLASSFFVNDIYRRFLVKDASSTHYVLIARLATVSVMSLAAFVAWQSKSIGDLFIVFLAFLSGVGPVYIARWLWWRVRAHVEIVAMVTSAVTTLVITFGGHVVPWPHGALAPNGILTAEGRLLIVVGLSLAATLTTLSLSAPPDPRTLVSFYRKVRPVGFWGPVRELAGDVGPREGVLPILVGIFGGVGFIFGAMLATGAWLLETGGAVGLTVVSAAGGVAMLWAVRRITAAADTPNHGE